MMEGKKLLWYLNFTGLRILKCQYLHRTEIILYNIYLNILDANFLMCKGMLFVDILLGITWMKKSEDSWVILHLVSVCALCVGNGNTPNINLNSF